MGEHRNEVDVAAVEGGKDGGEVGEAPRAELQTGAPAEEFEVVGAGAAVLVALPGVEGAEIRAVANP